MALAVSIPGSGFQNGSSFKLKSRTAQFGGMLAETVPMTSDRKHPSAAFWPAVALVAALVAYPLSFGPACWIMNRDVIRIRRVCTIYRPIFGVIEDGPECVSESLWSYLRLGCSQPEQTVARFMVVTGMADLNGPAFPGDFDE